ncbi:hypothetical protein NQT62_02245 [Limnobacter humi]|uniref:Uncharacterized protein n=1 Tax=Limnobacter humi TaxID=1778671 RepID=A0ABT1WCL3_9BURK|nr:hypothetical protein [Limnobacter humi]MCQ8895258.1 hypothetical protein [Limnobacter humi]
MTAAAGTLALSLLNDATETNRGMRRLQDDNDGCGSGKYRSELTDKDKQHYKWAFVGEGAAAGLGLVVGGVGIATQLTRCGEILMAIGGAFLLPAVGALALTGLAYGVQAATNGQCQLKT